MKKLLTLVLVGVMSLSMLTACGGDEGEDENLPDGSQIETEGQEEEKQPEQGEQGGEATGGAVTEETWQEVLKTQIVMGKLMQAMDQDTPEDVAAIADEMMAFSEEMTSKTREDYTEAGAKEAITTMTAYIGVMSPYVDVADDGTVTRKGE